jgi:hypothetical protein
MSEVTFNGAAPDGLHIFDRHFGGFLVAAAIEQQVGQREQSGQAAAEPERATR